MTIKKTSDSKNPTANLAIKNSRIKKYGKNKIIPSYYLEKGQEFQIELYNPTQDKVLTTIKLNNNPISGGLILRPGERVFLDRFLDSNKKFLFDTYKVENTKSTRKAIEPNGDVEIAFFKEIVVPEQTFLMGGSGTVTLDWAVDDLGTGAYNLTNCNTTTTNYVDSSSSGQGLTLTTNSLNLTGRQGYASPDKSEFLRGTTLKKSKSLKSKMSNSKTPTTIETGRVEKGSKSDQNLHEATGDFELSSFHVLRYKLLPKSEKQLSTKDYYTKYCGGCGAKCKTAFCSYCGAKQ